MSYGSVVIIVPVGEQLQLQLVHFYGRIRHFKILYVKIFKRVLSL